MIGRKKFAVIREELRAALAATGEDPIKWLDRRLAESKSSSTAKEGDELLQSLRRVLEAPPKSRRRSARPAGKANVHSVRPR